MAKKMIGLGSDGRLALQLPGGISQPIPRMQKQYAYLLIDCSSSMSGESIEQAKEGSLAFAENALGKGYLVGLIRFSSSANILCRPGDGLKALASSVEELRASGSTDMTEAIRLAVGELRLMEGIRAIVIATDGAPDSESTCLTAAEHAKAANIDIITIGTEDADHEFLARLATRSDLAIQVSSDQLRVGMSQATRLLPAGGRR